MTPSRVAAGGVRRVGREGAGAADNVSNDAPPKKDAPLCSCVPSRVRHSRKVFFWGTTPPPLNGRKEGRHIFSVFSEGALLVRQETLSSHYLTKLGCGVKPHTRNLG